MKKANASDLREIRAKIAEVKKQIAELRVERDDLRGERRRLQKQLGPRDGREIMPLSRVEKTNGVPSFVVGQRMMQRIHARAENPSHGLDGVGAVFADRERTAEFVRSHGVPVKAESEALDMTIIVHAFKGSVGLVEVRTDDRARHFDADGVDIGDVRPAVTYEGSLPAPIAFAQICSWSEILSSHIPRPYVQLFWIDRKSGAALDRIDVDPGRIPVLTPEWDAHLGKYFDSAHARFLLQPYRKGALDNRVPSGTFNFGAGSA